MLAVLCHDLWYNNKNAFGGEAMNVKRIFKGLIILIVLSLFGVSCGKGNERHSLMMSPESPVSTRAALDSSTPGNQLFLEWISFNSESVDYVKSDYITGNSMPSFVAQVCGESPEQEAEHKITAFIDGANVDHHFDPGYQTITFTPSQPLKPGSHSAGIAINFPDVADFRQIHFFFTVNPEPIKITGVLRDDPTRTLYVFFSEMLEPDCAGNPSNWGLNPGTMGIVDSVDIVLGGNVARLKLASNVESIENTPGPLELVYNSKRGLTKRLIITGEPRDKSGDSEEDCNCEIEYEELAQWSYDEREESALCYRIDYDEQCLHCPARFYWSFENIKTVANSDPCNFLGDCSEASMDATDDPDCFNNAPNSEGSFLITDNSIHTLQFARGMEFTYKVRVYADCDDDGTYESYKGGGTYNFTPLDCENPTFEGPYIGDGAYVANKLLLLANADKAHGHRIIYEDFQNNEEGFLQYIADLANSNPCNRFALIRATDNHTLHSIQACFTDPYRTPPPPIIDCCQETQTIYIAIRVDESPLASYFYNGEYYPGQETINWPDPEFDYIYKIDDQKVNEVEYAVIEINPLTVNDFVRVRWRDTIHNWCRTPRIWDKNNDSYQLQWVDGTFSSSSHQRQYINWSKDVQDGCDEPQNYNYICLALQVTPSPMFDSQFYVKLTYSDPPLDPQGRAFPWLNPDPGPHIDDNQGAIPCGFLNDPDSTPADIVLPVPCDGKVETIFTTTKCGGDNYDIAAVLYRGYPDTGTIEFGPINSPRIEVWRKYNLQVYFMDPDYMPMFGALPIAYNEAYIEFIAVNDANPTNYADDLIPCSIAQTGNNVIDYSDDIVPEGPSNDYFTDTIPYHSPVCEYTTVKNCFHIQGIDHFDDHLVRGFCCNYYPLHPLESHKHCFIAVGMINETYVDSIFVNRRTINHELGHGIRGLVHSGWVMSTSLDHNPELRFIATDLQLLRSGPCVGE